MYKYSVRQRDRNIRHAKDKLKTEMKAMQQKASPYSQK